MVTSPRHVAAGWSHFGSSDRIRTIFLHQRPHVSIAEATVLLGWLRGEMSRAIAAGEVIEETLGAREASMEVVALRC